MKLRNAENRDEKILGEWLKNESDCLLATNKNTFSASDYGSWLAAEDQHCFFLMNEDNEAVGYGEIWVDSREGDLELAHLIIDPARRSKGLGKILVQLLEARARDFQFPMLYMRVNPENAQAIKCYSGCGFISNEKLNEMFGNKWVWLQKDLTEQQGAAI